MELGFFFIMAGMGSVAEEVVRTDGSAQSLSFQPRSLAYTSDWEVKISGLPEQVVEWINR